MSKRPTGRLGNQIFQIHFLRQLEIALHEPSFRWGFNLQGLFNFQENQFSLSMLKRNKFERLNKEDLQQSTFNSLIDYIRTNLNSEKITIIPPGILGEVFFESYRAQIGCVLPMAQIANTDSKLCTEKQGLLIGIHFRGKDFERWNKHAAMEFNFYKNAIEQIIEINGSKAIRYSFVTDDPSHHVSRKIEQFCGTTYQSSSASADFQKLCSSQIIISGPSTFAFWASLMGNQSQLVLSKRWIDYTEELGDKFWHDVRMHYSSNFGNLTLV